MLVSQRADLFGIHVARRLKTAARCAATSQHVSAPCAVVNGDGSKPGARPVHHVANGRHQVGQTRYILVFDPEPCTTCPSILVSPCSVPVFLLVFIVTFLRGHCTCGRHHSDLRGSCTEIERSHCWQVQFPSALLDPFLLHIGIANLGSCREVLTQRSALLVYDIEISVFVG